jgi:hypothetical protein
MRYWGMRTRKVCLSSTLRMSGKLLLNFMADQSGIDVVRNKIKTFAQRKVTLPAGRHKIIILDEADS